MRAIYHVWLWAPDDEWTQRRYGRSSGVASTITARHLSLRLRSPVLPNKRGSAGLGPGRRAGASPVPSDVTLESTTWSCK